MGSGAIYVRIFQNQGNGTGNRLKLSTGIESSSGRPETLGKRVNEWFARRIDRPTQFPGTAHKRMGGSGLVEYHRRIDG